MNFFKDYRLCEKIGSGGFGEVFRCLHETGHPYAIKIEKIGKNVLKHEHAIMKSLNSEINPYICMVYEYGTLTKTKQNCMVMELLGDNLSVKMQKYGVYSGKNLLNVSLMMLNAIEFLHNKGYVHRDIKPENFAFSLDESRLYMMDFGLTKLYSKLNYKENKPLVGTARYASLNAHLGIELSKRDDIESMIYSIVYLGKGCLPWQGIKASNKAKKHKKILEIKQSISVSDLCEGLPSTYEQILLSCSYLEFNENPNYEYYRMLITDKLRENRYPIDHKWNWGGK
ncbi:putative casein kinase I like protein [Dictyocoela muelleri]|nr:putative casein kinase I like protein [Dictyocoela muelleri]